MSYQSVKVTYQEIISEVTSRNERQYINCHECGDYIEDGEVYWDIEGEILCKYCAIQKYQRRNGGSIF